MIAPSMPEAEAAHLIDAYQRGQVLLEYGSGASTKLASQMFGKLVMSVESDRQWARNLRREIDEGQPKSSVIVYHVDIGATGPWGRPIDESGWKRYHCYPNAIWDEPFFRHPDIVLIDGRFRPACLITTMLHVTRPVTVLFDDYIGRPRYGLIERIVSPTRLIGRMAEFHVQPNQLRSQDIGFAIRLFFDVTTHGQGAAAYRLAADDSTSRPDAVTKGSTS